MSIKSLKLAFAAAIFGSMTATVAAEEVNLRLATAIHQSAVQNKLIFDPWVARLNEQGKGSIRVTNTYANLVNVMTVYDAVVNGVVDIAWILHGFTPGKFPKSSVIQLPFETNSAEEATFALWRLYERGLIADEYKDVKVLALHGFTQAVLHGKAPIRKMEDIKGLKTRISSKLLADVITALGGTPVSLSSVQAYQHLNRGLVDADFVQWTIVCVARINEATKFHLEGPLGGQGAMMIVNKAAWEKLSDAGRKVLERNSGIEFALDNGRLQDRIHSECREQTRKMPGQTIETIAPAELERWKTAINPVVEGWVNSTPNGKAILEAFREEVKAFRARK